MIFVTGNAAKAEQLAKYLEMEVPHKNIDLDEVQSLDLQEVVEHKAQTAYAAVGKPVLVEDTALTFTALGRLPGPFIKWFLEELNNEGLCWLLDRYQDRSAIAEVMYGYCDGDAVAFFSSKKTGSVAEHPTGEGFGWDPIFIPDGSTKTYGEMTEEERAVTSLRKPALLKLKEYFS